MSKNEPYCFQCYCVLNPDVDVPRKYMNIIYVKSYKLYSQTLR